MIKFTQRYDVFVLLIFWKLQINSHNLVKSQSCICGGNSISVEHLNGIKYGENAMACTGGHIISQAHLLFNSILRCSINLDGSYIIITAYQRLVNWFAIINRPTNTNKYRPFRYFIIKFTWILIEVLLYLIVFFSTLSISDTNS